MESSNVMSETLTISPVPEINSFSPLVTDRKHDRVAITDIE